LNGTTDRQRVESLDRPRGGGRCLLDPPNAGGTTRIGLQLRVARSLRLCDSRGAIHTRRAAGRASRAVEPVPVRRAPYGGNGHAGRPLPGKPAAAGGAPRRAGARGEHRAPLDGRRRVHLALRPAHRTRNRAGRHRRADLHALRPHPERCLPALHPDDPGLATRALLGGARRIERRTSALDRRTGGHLGVGLPRRFPPDLHLRGTTRSALRWVWPGLDLHTRYTQPGVRARCPRGSNGPRPRGAPAAASPRVCGARQPKPRRDHPIRGVPDQRGVRPAAPRAARRAGRQRAGPPAVPVAGGAPRTRPAPRPLRTPRAPHPCPRRLLRQHGAVGGPLHPRRRNSGLPHLLRATARQPLPPRRPHGLHLCLLRRHRPGLRGPGTDRHSPLAHGTTRGGSYFCPAGARGRRRTLCAQPTRHRTPGGAPTEWTTRLAGAGRRPAQIGRSGLPRRAAEARHQRADLRGTRLRAESAASLRRLLRNRSSPVARPARSGEASRAVAAARPDERPPLRTRRNTARRIPAPGRGRAPQLPAVRGRTPPGNAARLCRHAGTGRAGPGTGPPRTAGWRAPGRGARSRYLWFRRPARRDRPPGAPRSATGRNRDGLRGALPGRAHGPRLPRVAGGTRRTAPRDPARQPHLPGCGRTRRTAPNRLRVPSGPLSHRRPRLGHHTGHGRRLLGFDAPKSARYPYSPIPGSHTRARRR